MFAVTHMLSYECKAGYQFTFVLIQTPEYMILIQDKQNHLSDVPGQL